jgi:hypothetical protein
MQNSHLNWPCESSHRGLNQRHTAKVVLPVEELVDEFGEASSSLARVIRLLRLDPKEVCATDPRDVIRELGEVAGLT